MSENLTAALAAVQADLPRISKSETAEVKTKTGGTYKYTYADLAAVSAAVLPKLAAQGLAWVTAPTLVDGRLVLAYELRHTSGEKVEGTYPLTGGTPQEIGSAITYARRYCLCSVTGVAPESDDDDAAAASHKRTDDGWEQAAKPPTTAQAKHFNDLTDGITSATREQTVLSVGETVRKARAMHLITDAQYDQLARRAAAKLAELRAEPVGDGQEVKP
jgi:hypothetical protein